MQLLLAPPSGRGPGCHATPHQPAPPSSPLTRPPKPSTGYLPHPEEAHTHTHTCTHPHVIRHGLYPVNCCLGTWTYEGSLNSWGARGRRGASEVGQERSSHHPTPGLPPGSSTLTSPPPKAWARSSANTEPDPNWNHAPQKAQAVRPGQGAEGFRTGRGQLQGVGVQSPDQLPSSCLQGCGQGAGGAASYALPQVPPFPLRPLSRPSPHLLLPECKLVLGRSPPTPTLPHEAQMRFQTRPSSRDGAGLAANRGSVAAGRGNTRALASQTS